MDVADRIRSADSWQAWVQRVEELLSRDEPDQRLTADVHAAVDWWHARQLDTGYLEQGPRLWVWREAQTIQLEWA